MIYIIYGDDRVRGDAEAKRILGTEYEVFDGEELAAGDLPSIFMGMSLFAEKRKILVKDLPKELFEKVPEYVKTVHEVVIFESNLDKRTAAYKELAKNPGVKFMEFKLAAKVDRNLAFNVYDMAMRDGKKAVEMLRPAELTEDPYMMMGAFSWKAIDNFRKWGGEKEKRALRELSRTDILMKTTSFQPWTLLETFLLRVGLSL